MVWKNKLLLGLALFLLASSCQRVYFLDWEIPSSFEGWVRVKYNMTACPRSEGDWFSHVIRIGSDGTACTALDLTATTISDYFRVDEGGKRVEEIKETHWGEGGRLWGDRVDLAAQQREFFVGQEADFRDPLRRHREGWAGEQITDGPGVNFEIPAGYHGPVEVTFGDGACSGSRFEGERLVVLVPAHGQGCSTALRMPTEGPIVYLELAPDGNKKPLLWSGLDPDQGRIVHERTRRDGSRFAFSVLPKLTGSK
jgi:hypothetical protein